MEQATQIPQGNLLQYRNKTPSDHTPLVVPYHSTLELLQGIVKQLQPILNGDHILKEIFPEPPLWPSNNPQPLRAHHQIQAVNRPGPAKSERHQTLP